MSVTLPAMHALRLQFEEKEPVFVCIEAGKYLKLAEAQLDPTSRKLRNRLREILAEESRHLVAYKDLLLKASCLDPRFRHLKFVENSDKESTIRSLAAEAYELAKETSNADAAAPAPEEAQVVDLAHVQAFRLAMFDGPARAGQAQQSLKHQVKAELNSYLQEPQAPANAVPEEWWKSRERELCHLAPLARRYLAGPATTADCERLFSLAKHLLTEDRLGVSVNTALQLSQNLVGLDMLSS